MRECLYFSYSLLAITELSIIEAGVEAVLGEEGGVVALFDDLALIQDVDAVGSADGAQAVGDDDGGASCSSRSQALLDQGFGDGVDIGGGLVQDEDARVGQDGAGDADELALADGEVDAAFQDPGLVALRQGADKFVGVGQAGGLPSAPSLASGRPKLMFSAMVPENRKGSWGTKPIWRRRESWVTLRTSMPSMRTAPSLTS